MVVMMVVVGWSEPEMVFPWQSERAGVSAKQVPYELSHGSHRGTGDPGIAKSTPSPLLHCGAGS